MSVLTICLLNAKFAQHLMISAGVCGCWVCCGGKSWLECVAGVCCGGKSWLLFLEEKAKLNADYDFGRLLPELMADCNRLLPAGFIFQQDGTPAHMARVTQDWLQANCLGFIEKNHYPPNFPDLNPLVYHMTSGAPYWKYTINSSRSLRRLMSWKLLCRPSGKSCHKTTSTKRWQTSPSTWLPARLPVVASSSICSKGLSISKSASSSQHQKTALFRAV